MAPKTDVIEQLRTRIAELEAEVERLSVAHVKACQANADSQAELAAEQLNNKLLRDALEHCMADGDFDTDDARTSFKEGMKALATPTSTEALDKYVAEKVKEAVKEADDQILAAKNLLAIMHRDGGHHQFAVGFDQAIQDAMAVYYELTRQRDLAVEWLERCAAHVRPTATSFYEEIVEAISTIKESDGK